mmetsp:Transcript_3535/g.6124  ORF Transcript_3535/g.6124 Transcript_3535/m.6124 type:complete len:328 (-) Transcript_3535:784-1767(-)
MWARRRETIQCLALGVILLTFYSLSPLFPSPHTSLGAPVPRRMFPLLWPSLEVQQRKQMLRGTAVMVRCMRPPAGAVERIEDWRLSLPKEVDFWVQIDNSTGGADADFEAIRNGLSNPGSVLFSAFTVNEMTARFPSLNNLVNATNFYNTHRPLSWGFHVEALNLWYENIRTRKQYDHVWVVECDVGYSGNFGDFVTNMMSRKEDLLLPSMHPGDWNWAFISTCTPAFASLLPNVRDRMIGSEQIQRISAKLFDSLLDWSNHGISAWSEMATPSAAKYHNLTILELTSFWKDGHTAWNQRVSREEWNEIMRSTDPKVTNRFYHALKW